MKAWKILLVAAACILLLVLNFAVVYCCFYQFVFNFTAEQDIAQLGEEFQGASVLGMHLDSGGWGGNWYLLVKMASGETRLLAMQGSQYFANRYCYLPDHTLLIPDERPYSCTARTTNDAVIIYIDAGNRLQTRESAAGYPVLLDSLYSYLPFLLFIAELALGGITVYLRKKRAAHGRDMRK